MPLQPMQGYVSGIRVHVSHFGYHPVHPKDIICTNLGSENTFQVVDVANGEVAYVGELVEREDDFGRLRVGDFTALTAEGEYYVRVGPHRSFGTFRIQDRLWDDYQRMIALHFFGIRRVGEDSVVGNLGEFQGVRWDDARLGGGDGWRYLGTSFADGDDRRIYPSVSLVVAQYCELKRTNPFWDTGDWIYSQVRWGLDGALSFLDKDGILRRALYAFPDNDTDGSFYSGDEKILGDAFDQTVTCNEYGLVNREVVYASLLLGPAEAVHTYRHRDPEFFGRVQKLCEIAYGKIERIFKPFQESGFTLAGHDFSPFARKYSASAWIWLSALMHQITGEARYRENAIVYADRLMALQQAEPLGDDQIKVSGWYRQDAGSIANPWGEKPEQEVMVTPWLYQCLFKLLEFYPQHECAEAWKQSIRRYGRDFLLAASRLNAFGHTPMKVGEDGLKRRQGTLSYQYFGCVGRMFHQIGNAAYLIEAGKLLADQELLDAGWRQIQWFAGVNPLGIGCIYGLSPNIPSGQYHSDTFGRCVLGGTKNGMTSGPADEPEVRFWEYYTYANLNALWFATAIGSRRFVRELEIWPKHTREAPHEPVDPKHMLAAFPVRLKGGFAYRFTGLQASAEPLKWFVNGVEGGSDETGTVTSDGLFQAPPVSALQTVRIRVERMTGNGCDETEATIMPVPERVRSLTCTRLDDGVLLRWGPVADRCSGYTIWRRLPVGEAETGTIFERVWAVPSNVDQFNYTLDAPVGTEFMIRAYHRSPDMIYGYGPASPIVRLVER